MFHFDYETIRRPDEALCVFINCTITGNLPNLKKGDFFTKIKHYVDRKCFEFYDFDKLVKTIYVGEPSENNCVRAS